MVAIKWHQVNPLQPRVERGWWVLNIVFLIWQEWLSYRTVSLKQKENQVGITWPTLEHCKFAQHQKEWSYIPQNNRNKDKCKSKLCITFTYQRTLAYARCFDTLSTGRMWVFFIWCCQKLVRSFGATVEFSLLSVCGSLILWKNQDLVHPNF